MSSKFRVILPFQPGSLQYNFYSYVTVSGNKAEVFAAIFFSLIVLNFHVGKMHFCPSNKLTR